MSTAVKKMVLLLLALVVSFGFFSLSYKVLDMTAFDASVVPICILTFSVCLLFMPLDEERNN